MKNQVVSLIYHQFRKKLHIIHSKSGISSLRKRYNLRLMIYSLRRDDMPLLSQWIKNTTENDTFSVVFLVHQKGLRNLFCANVCAYLLFLLTKVQFAMRIEVQAYSLYKKCNKPEPYGSGLLHLVHQKGLEPSRRGHQILSLARLPIPPLVHIEGQKLAPRIYFISCGLRAKLQRLPCSFS